MVITNYFESLSLNGNLKSNTVSIHLAFGNIQDYNAIQKHLQLCCKFLKLCSPSKIWNFFMQLPEYKMC